MTTLSAGATAGLLVALMVVSATDAYAAGPEPTSTEANAFTHPGSARGFNPQPDPPKAVPDGAVRMGDGSVRIAGR